MNSAGIAILSHVTKAVSGKSIAEHISQALTRQSASLQSITDAGTTAENATGFAALLPSPQPDEGARQTGTDALITSDVQPEELTPTLLSTPALKAVSIPGLSGVELTAEKVNLATDLRMAEARLLSDFLTLIPPPEVTNTFSSKSDSTLKVAASADDAGAMGLPVQRADVSPIVVTMSIAPPQDAVPLDVIATKIADVVQKVLSNFDARTGGTSLSALTENLASATEVDAHTTTSLTTVSAQAAIGVLGNVFSAVSDLVGLERAVPRPGSTSSQTFMLSRLPSLQSQAEQSTTSINAVSQIKPAEVNTSNFPNRRTVSNIANLANNAGLPRNDAVSNNAASLNNSDMKTSGLTLPNIQISQRSSVPESTGTTGSVVNRLMVETGGPALKLEQATTGRLDISSVDADANSRSEVSLSSAKAGQLFSDAPTLLAHRDARLSAGATPPIEDPRVRAVLAKISPGQPNAATTPSPNPEFVREAIQVSQLGVAVEAPTTLEDPMLAMPESTKSVISEVTIDKMRPGSMQQTAENKPNSRFFGVLANQIKDIKFSEARTRIELNPAGLGGIEIDMAPDETGRLHVIVRADNALVLETLRNDRETLAALLSDQGESLDMGNLDFEEFRQGPGSDEFEGSGFGSDSEISDPETETLAHQPTITGEMLDIMT